MFYSYLHFNKVSYLPSPHSKADGVLGNKKIITSVLILFIFFSPFGLIYAQSEEGLTQVATESVGADQGVENNPIVAPEVSGSSEPSVIETGDSVSSVDVVNEVNVNETNSDSEVVVISGSLEDSSIDLREEGTSETIQEGVGESACEDCTSVVVQNENEAILTNNVEVISNTGNNESSSSDHSIIRTGDSIAAANVVNMVNTNIVDSKYTLLVFNNLGNWSGDIILPNGNFFENFFSMFNSNCNCSDGNLITNSNSGDLENNANTSSNSGENNSNSPDSEITTGQSLSSFNNFNLLNTNIYNNSSFYLLIKVFGDWSGNIFNLPSNIKFKNTPAGIFLYDSSGEELLESVLENENLNYASISNNNNAKVLNNLNIQSNSGQNTASSEGSSVIETGNSYSGANLVNIVNTNIVSSNWFTVIGNVFGNWSGNISFGQPDLWIGTVANIEGVVEAGSNVNFKTVIKNKGDARASGVVVNAAVESPYFDLLTPNSNLGEWNFDHIDPGETIEFYYSGRVDGYLPAGNNNVNIENKVRSYESDGNNFDNIDSIIVPIFQSGDYHSFLSQGAEQTYPKISVSKSHSIPSSIIKDGVEMIPSEGKVDYQIIIKNEGGLAYEGILFDRLKNEKGEVISEQEWDLGEIYPDEEITITYTTEFSSSTNPGIYTNEAWVESFGGDYHSYNGALAKEYNSNIASDKVILSQKEEVVLLEIKQEEDIFEISEGEILGVQTEINENYVIDPNLIDNNNLIVTDKFCFEPEKENGMLNLSGSFLIGTLFFLVVEKRGSLKNKSFLL